MADERRKVWKIKREPSSDPESTDSISTLSVPTADFEGWDISETPRNNNEPVAGPSRLCTSTPANSGKEQRRFNRIPKVIKRLQYQPQLPRKRKSSQEKDPDWAGSRRRTNGICKPIVQNKHQTQPKGKQTHKAQSPDSDGSLNGYFDHRRRHKQMLLLSEQLSNITQQLRCLNSDMSSKTLRMKLMEMSKAQERLSKEQQKWLNVNSLWDHLDMKWNGTGSDESSDDSDSD